MFLNMTSRNPDYISIVLCSKGLGANYAKENQLKHKWDKEKTIITYKAHNGQDLPLPRYYKTTIYTDDQRQLLWLYAEDKGVKWVKGFEVIGANTVNKDYYERLLKEKNENGIGLHEDNIEEIERYIYFVFSVSLSFFIIILLASTTHIISNMLVSIDSFAIATAVFVGTFFF